MSDYDVAIEQKNETKLRFNLCDHTGRPSRARGSFRMNQFPQLAVKTAQSDTEHGDREPPYASREQLDFSGGRGWDDFERDKSRFYNFYRAQTWRDGVVLLGPEEKYAEGIRTHSEENWFSENPDTDLDMHRLVLDDDTEYYSYGFTAGANITVAYVYLALGLDYDKGAYALTIDIYSDDGASDPNASLATTGNVSPAAYEQVHRFEFETPVALTSGTVYHVVVRNYETPTPTGYNRTGYYVLAADTVAGGVANKSSDGASWSEGDKGIFFRLTAADSDFDIFPFEHLGALYMALSFRDGSDPQIFMNGERGSVTSSTSTTLTDSGAAFTVDALIGCLVFVYAGIGAEAERPWRLITDNDGTSITVGEAWDVTPTEGSKYVVIRSDVFTEVTPHYLTGRITDVCTFGNIVYFCQGDYGAVVHMYDDTFEVEDYAKGSYMRVAPDSANDIPKVYLARSSFPPTIATAAPVYADDDYAIEDLVFTYDVTVGDPDMDLDDASWADYGTIDSSSRGTGRVYNGRYSRYYDTGAVDSGATQDVTVEDATYYKIVAHVNIVSDGSVKMEFEGVELTATSVVGEWVRLTGYGLSAGVAGTLRFLSKGGNTIFYIDAVWMEKVETGLPFGHNRITNLLVAGDPKRLHVMTDAGMLIEEAGAFFDISPSEIVNVRDFRNGQAAISKGEFIYFNFLDNVVKYYDEEISIIGPNLDEGLPAARLGQVKDLVSYGEYVLCAIDGGEDNISSILLHNGVGWHEYYRAPAAGIRITSLWVQSLPGNYVDRVWFNEGGDIVWLGIDLIPEMNDDFKFNFSGWVEMATIYGSMGEVEKFFQSIKITADDLDTTHYISVAPRDEIGWKNQGQPPAGETYEHLWGSLTSSPTDENTIDEFWNMDNYTLRRLQVHIGLHTTRATLIPDLRSIVVDFIEHMPLSWGYTMRLLTQDSRRSLTGERAGDAIEDDLTTLKGFVNSAEPIRLFTPFSYANNITVKLTSITDIEPVGYTRRDAVERAVFTLHAIDA